MDDRFNLLRETLTRLYIYILKTLKKKKNYQWVQITITDSNFTDPLKN